MSDAQHAAAAPADAAEPGDMLVIATARAA